MVFNGHIAFARFENQKTQFSNVILVIATIAEKNERIRHCRIGKITLKPKE